MSTENRLVSVRRLLDHIGERLALDFGFILWDGSTIPNSLAPGTLALCVADEGAIAALVRRPTLDTLLNLWVSGRLDLRNGDLFDLVAGRPKVRTKDFLSTLKKSSFSVSQLNFYSCRVADHGRWNGCPKILLRTAVKAPIAKTSNTIMTCQMNSMPSFSTLIWFTRAPTLPT